VYRSEEHYDRTLNHGKPILMNPKNNRNKEYNTTAIKDPEILGIITIFLNIKSTYIYSYDNITIPN
jgi:hypothetical protein